MSRHCDVVVAHAHMVDATPLVGWGGVMTFFVCDNVLCWWHVHTWSMLRHWWGGVGWGGMIMFFACAHMVDVTPL